MKIHKIEYENFRNFRDKGNITCSTDGKVTIVYGKNGDGKTTLHQLFQWIFYGNVKFNKTATQHLYNLAFESEQEYGSVFHVWGCIEFEHEGHRYALSRTNIYKKQINYSEIIGEEVSLQREDDDYNWNRVDRPLETIEKILPSGLSEYFFFDGESMIADLRVKGKDSANKLRKAIFSMFDLDILEAALDHIGRTDLKTTVLGKLYLSKGKVASGSQISAIKTNIESAQNVLADHSEKIQNAKEEKQKQSDTINQISEMIGGSKSKQEYENERKDLGRQRDIFLDNAASEQGQFGDAIIDMFPRLLISKAVNDAKGKLNYKVNNSHLPGGLSKRLIYYLTSDVTTECICGNPLCAENKDHIREFLKLLPPRSYVSVYGDFIRTTDRWGNEYDKEKIETIIKRVLDNQEGAADCDRRIKALDEAEKQSKDIEDLIVARQDAEDRIQELDELIVGLESKVKGYEVYLKKQMKEFDKLTSENKDNAIIQQRIDIMQEVATIFSDRLVQASDTISHSLEDNIQDLLNKMLTSRRSVSVTRDFAVRVTDSFNDESKSEGQFAVVSFAYIGGILTLLKNENELSNKEYPLVLDGPFSKLDPDQRQNVVDLLPDFASQVIIFSKDDLHGIISPDHIGRVWTIRSNAEKNIATVEEGKLWK